MRMGLILARTWDCKALRFAPTQKLNDKKDRACVGEEEACFAQHLLEDECFGDAARVVGHGYVILSAGMLSWKASQRSVSV